MHNDNIKLIVAATTSAVAVGIAVRSSLKVHREERAKRQAIHSNMLLDILAIRHASMVMAERIDNGEIRSLDTLADTLHNEIAFQKIAIREE